MDISRLRSERLRSHRLTAPAASVVDAAAHMTATQAQEFWGGRWALAARTRGELRLSGVDAEFERGRLIRSWTQRGTLHILRPADLGWLLAVTGARQEKQYAAPLRNAAITASTLTTAERAVRAALSGGNRLTRREFAEVLQAAGIDTAGMRGNHILVMMCLRQVTCLGPVVPRDGAPSRDQYVVLAEEWISDATAPADPLAEMFVHYIASHGPAGVADFRWWAGVPLGMARAAVDAAGDRVVEVEQGLYTAAGPRPRRSALPEVLALPPFEEYYLSYADRSVPCPPEFTPTVGPSLQGLVRPVLLADGEVIGAWTHSVAVGRHHLDPVPELFTPGAAPAPAVADALARFARFITG
ncbi:winged helix DNA-binding domain-containing protein [Microbacterium invictum]|uniref:Winged helix DNA-binding domain-containing protein n=1 Tax=Microbacterium invictum TaxID=515415 RepID=A0AA40SP69_9MICO|nr:MULTISPECIES: winged helix DNA-binding domain-containing protein [Microbacterium]MBB4139850.1 hypothetical protein [Microbacterium invictum]